MSDTTGTEKRGGVLASVQNTAQAVLMEDCVKGMALLADAARSRAYLYPIRGLLYFATHRTLWKPLLSRLGAYAALSIGITTTMFLLTYLPQLAVLVLFNGPLAVLSTVLLILSESAAITNAVARRYLVEEALLDTYDGAMVARGQAALVREGREVKAGGGGDPMARLGRVLKNPFEGYGVKAVVRYLMYLPLNFIPVIGTVVFVFMQAKSRGRRVHDRLKNFSSSQKSDWLDKNVAPCTAFALTATLLEMIPFASILFTFTNAVSAAIWASDIETRKDKATAGGTGTAPSLREKAKSAE